MISIKLLLIFMIISAFIAVEIKSMIASIAAFGILGLGLSLGFLILQAPDLAAILLIIEIVTLTILIITFKQNIYSSIKNCEINIVTKIFIFVFLSFFLIISYKIVQELPAFGSPIMKTSEFYIKESFSKTGASNIVSAIALNFRLYDSLSSVILILLIITGVIYITEKNK